MLTYIPWTQKLYTRRCVPLKQHDVREFLVETMQNLKSKVYVEKTSKYVFENGRE